MPDDNWYQNIHDILNNLSYGCIASVVVAWLIDCANVNNQNSKSAATYNLVFEDLKGNLVCFIGILGKYFVINLLINLITIEKNIHG